MQNNSNVTEILNDLIRINRDRVEGYEKAIDELEKGDTDLKALFQQYAQQSGGYITELTAEVTKLGEKAASDTTVSGKVYRVWMDLKATFTRDERTSTLESCEYGEDAAQKAYKEALGKSAELPSQVANLITRQQANLRSAHDTVKRQRDMHTVK
ncbi:MAG: PA2169 family four-helix-bundle protein [Chitinophagaceae bacterium]|nr:PA2169 family four-helix-bundle protein [Chitinophagaceae bacterium]